MEALLSIPVGIAFFGLLGIPQLLLLLIPGALVAVPTLLILKARTGDRERAAEVGEAAMVVLCSLTAAGLFYLHYMACNGPFGAAPFLWIALGAGTVAWRRRETGPRRSRALTALAVAALLAVPIQMHQFGRWRAKRVLVAAHGQRIVDQVAASEGREDGEAALAAWRSWAEQNPRVGVSVLHRRGLSIAVHNTFAAGDYWQYRHGDGWAWPDVSDPEVLSLVEEEIAAAMRDLPPIPGERRFLGGA